MNLSELTIEQRAQINQYYYGIKKSLYPTLQLAIENEQTEMIEEMINSGTYVTEENLISAICMGNVKVFDKLLSTRESISDNVIYAAIKNSRLAILKILVERCDLPILSLAYAAATSTQNIVQYILSLDKESITDHVLLEAVRQDNMRTFPYLSKFTKISQNIKKQAKGNIKKFLES